MAISRSQMPQQIKKAPGKRKWSAARKRKIIARNLAVFRSRCTALVERRGNGNVKKDACYHTRLRRGTKFSRARTASGAIAKCRKVGAKNWGNKAQRKKSKAA